MSVITLISVLGVAAGVCALVIALAINNGFREELEKSLLGATANINLIRTSNDGIANYEKLTERLSRLPHVVAAAPALYEQVLISSRSRAQGIVLKGVEPELEMQVGDLLKRIREGSVEPLMSHPGGTDGGQRPPLQQNGVTETNLNAPPQAPSTDPIVIGKELATSLGVSVGDTVLVTSPQGYMTPFEIVPKFRHFKVVGIFNSGFYDFDASWAFTSLDAAQRLFDLKSVASVIEFRLDDVYRAPEVAETIRKAAGPGFQTTTWIEENHSLFSAMKLERLVTVLTIGLIVLVAALNIFVTLVMMVMEKNRDIAVLKSMGARSRQVWAVFALHGLLIGAVGTLVGLLFGYGWSWFGDKYHLIPLQADVYALSYVPFHARPVDGLWIAIAALSISFLATLYPSRSAEKLDPVEILRYE